MSRRANSGKLGDAPATIRRGACRPSRLRLADQVQRFLRDVAANVPFDCAEWQEPIALLLTHPRPPAPLRGVRDALRALIARDVHALRITHVDLVLAAIEGLPAPSEYLIGLRLALQAYAATVSSDVERLVNIARQFMWDGQLDNPLEPTRATEDARPGRLPPESAKTVVDCAIRRAVDALLKESRRGRDAFSHWSSHALLAAADALLIAYAVCQIGTTGHVRKVPRNLLIDFRQCGSGLWRKLDFALAEIVRHHRVLKDEAERRESAVCRLALYLESRCPQESSRPSVTGPIDRLEGFASHLVVCREPIPRSSDKQDREEIERHRILERPLPVARLPDPTTLAALKLRLGLEFPWAQGVLDVLFDDLAGRANIGAAHLTFAPTLLVGPPGAGKSRLARRMAEVLELPRLDVSLNGTSDTKILGGTNRGWATGRPSDLATLLATRRSASAIVLLDEIDKAHDARRDQGGVLAYLLGLLEPETAGRHYDGFLKVACDFSKVSWLGTANSVARVPGPLRSRLRILALPQPSPESFPAIAEATLQELAKRWAVDVHGLPRLSELQIDWRRLASARQVRMAVEDKVSRWCLELRKH
jgi:hypothetical protein